MPHIVDQSEVSSNIEIAHDEAEDTLIAANTFLNSLITIATSAITAGNNFEGSLPDQVDYNSVPVVDIPVVVGIEGSRPDPSDLDLPGTPEAPVFPPFAVLPDVVLPADDLLAPTHNFEYLEAAYISALLDPLKAKLLADLTNGGFGIDTADEAALFQRARDRETAAAMVRIDEVGRAMAARGFPLPPGELSIHIDRAHQELQSKLSGVSREIFVDSAKRFVENRQFTIQEVRQLETVLIGFHNSIQERTLNVAKAVAEYAIAVYNQLLARYRTRLEAAKITTDVQLGRAQVEIARMQGTLGVFQGQIAAYEARLRSLIEPFKARVDLYRVDVADKNAIIDALTQRAALQQKVLEAVSQQNIDISRLNVENTRARLQAVMTGLQFGMEATKFGSQQLFTTLAAMWGSLNTLSVQSATE